jgi:transcriptional regulator with XRE-family HTH domain
LEKYVTTFESLWHKLEKSKKYRAAYAMSFLKRSIPFQIQVLRKKHCGSQAVLAERSGVTQGVISRAEDPDYGNLTINTIGRIASGLDVAFVGKFVPFSELVKFSNSVSEEDFENILTFEEETVLSQPGWAALLAIEQLPKKPPISSKSQKPETAAAGTSEVPWLIRGRKDEQTITTAQNSAAMCGAENENLFGRLG